MEYECRPIANNAPTAFFMIAEVLSLFKYCCNLTSALSDMHNSAPNPKQTTVMPHVFMLGEPAGQTINVITAIAKTVAKSHCLVESQVLSDPK